MTEIIVKFPAKHKALAKAVKALLDHVVEFERTAPRMRSVEYRKHEGAVADLMSQIERETHGVSLAALDETAARIRIDGVEHVRVLSESVAQYKTRVGPVPVSRSLYRAVGDRNGKTVNTITLRTGALEDEWLPGAASAMAHRLARGTSREAEEAAEVEGTLPYSRSSFEKIGHAVGARMASDRASIEDALVAEMPIPDDAASVSVALDRTSLPMEEPRPRPVGRPRKGAPKNPVQVAHRMAWTGTVTLHDKDGDAIHTIRYGRMPHEDGESLAEAVASDALALVRRRPDLKVVTLGDGAEQIQRLLETHVDTQTFGNVWRLLDFWHVLEKLGAALAVMERDESVRKQRLAEWRRQLVARVGASARILAEIHNSGCESPRNKECPVHAAITYLTNQAPLMRYAEARRAGIPIGSGNVEATCKSLIGIRMKRPGARWKAPTGGEVITMRAHQLSGRWRRAAELALPSPVVEIRAA